MLARHGHAAMAAARRVAAMQRPLAATYVTAEGLVRPEVAATHAVVNQVPQLEDRNVYDGDHVRGACIARARASLTQRCRR